MSLDTVQLLGALRRITQSLDTHSKHLEQSAGLTFPQLLVLETLRSEREPLTAGQLAARVSLTQGTITSILDRLEVKHLVARVRAAGDRRRVLVALTEDGLELLRQAPPLLRPEFTRAWNQLSPEERRNLIDAVERLAALMRQTEPAAVASSAASADVLEP